MRRNQDPLFAEKKRSHPALRLFFILFLVFLIVVFVLNAFNNKRVNLLTEKITVPYLPSSLENFRILHISDLHGQTFGEMQHTLTTAIGSSRYDIVCITGDVCGKDGTFDPFVQLLAYFRAQNKPVYFIPGDEDPNPITAQPHNNPTAKADYIVAAENEGAIYLDAPMAIDRGNSRLWLYPEWAYSLDVDASIATMNKRMAELEKEPSDAQSAAAICAVMYQLDQMERIRQARRVSLESDTHIVLTHHPLKKDALGDMLTFTSSANTSYVHAVSLVLAGHYVGGQWRLPGIGALRVPASSELGISGWFPDDQQVTGLSSYLGIPQYVNPGLGVSDQIGLPAFRFLNTPAVTVITLTSKITL